VHGPFGLAHQPHMSEVNHGLLAVAASPRVECVVWELMTSGVQKKPGRSAGQS
jgi:hypothetical protein